MRRQFERMRGRLGLVDQVTMLPLTFQAFDPAGERFDVILLHNSVNHLDEKACIQLLESESARATYLALFGRLASMAADGATLLLCDCSRHNLFARLHLRNPVASTIEWHKHQAPETWVSLLEKAGFRNPQIRWTSLNSLHTAGKILTANRYAAYLLTSHFRLRMTR